MTPDTAGAIHMHSDYSHDGVDSLEALREFCIARHMRWVGLTDHAEDLEPDAFAEYQAHCRSLSDDAFSFIPGLEFRFAGFRGVHLFAIGLTEWMQPRTFEDFFEGTAKIGAFTVLAHPVICDYAPPQIVLDRIDAIEIWNTRYNTRYLPDPKSIALYEALHARRPSVVATVGLDLHDIAFDGEVRTLISAEDLPDPTVALKAGRFRTTGRNTTFDSTPRVSPRSMRNLRAKRFVLDTLSALRRRLADNSRSRSGWK